MLKKYSFLLLATGLCLSAANAQTKKPAAKKAPAKTTTASKTSTSKAGAQGGWTKGVDDLDYKVIVHGTGKTSPQLGEGVQVHIFQKVGDSLLDNSYNRNGGKPIAFPIQEARMKGDLMDGIRKMHVGDSTLFRLPVDTFLARAQQPRPDWVKAGSYVTYGVKLVSIKSKAEMDAEQAKMQAEQAKAQEAAMANVKVQAETDDKLIQEYLGANGVKDFQKTPSGLYYVVTKEGTGDKAMPGQKATVNYTGKNIKGETFDSNVDPVFGHVSPFEFNLGQHQVIAGWDEGVALMKKGGKVTLYIPSGMAYGPMARAEKIPANAILIFDIELVDAK